MAEYNWQDAGDQIKKLVQDAVEKGDYSHLSSTITGVINDALDGVEDSIRSSIRGGRPDKGYSRDRYQYTNSEAADRIRRNMETARRSRPEQNRYEESQKKQKTSCRQVPAIVPGETAAGVQKWLGYGFGTVFGLGLIGAGVTWAALSLPAFAMLPGVAALAALTGVSMYAGIGGRQKQGLARRFRRYRQVLGERRFCRIEELASATGKSRKFVLKDLKKMISRGFFTEGYLDVQETTLITDRDTYQQYADTQAAYEQRRVKKSGDGTPEQAGTADVNVSPQAEKAARAAAELSPECREIISEGRRYIQHIRECNDKIPGEEFSAKLSQLELVVSRIFCELEKNPSVADDLKKMMNYYLPTIRKLLDAYCDLDAQPIRGQNIDTTKREIEAAIDTINVAFENLLDNLFQDEAWDISSDISVLNTMLAQEGLTGGKDFAKKDL